MMKRHTRKCHLKVWEIPDRITMNYEKELLDFERDQKYILQGYILEIVIRLHISCFEILVHTIKLNVLVRGKKKKDFSVNKNFCIHTTAFFCLYVYKKTPDALMMLPSNHLPKHRFNFIFVEKPPRRSIFQ